MLPSKRPCMTLTPCHQPLGTYMLATNTYACPLEVFFDHQNYVKHHKTWSANNYLFKPSSGMTQIVAPKSMNLVESTILFILLNMSLKHTFGGRYHLPKSHTIRLALFHLSYQCNCQVNYPLFTHCLPILFHVLRAMFSIEFSDCFML